MMWSKKSKLFFCIVLSLVFVFSFAACGGKQAANTDSKPAQQSSAQVQTQTAAVSEPVKLVMWNPAALLDTGDMKKEDMAIFRYIKKFEDANKNVTVEYVNQPADNFNDLFKAANASGNGPDVTLLWPGGNTTDYIPFLLPLNKYLTDEDYKNYVGWNMGRKDFKSEGDVYGFPAIQYSNIIYYNKDLLAKAGINDSNLPKTWDEFLAACEKVKGTGKTPLFIGDKEGFITQWAVASILASEIGDAGVKFIDGSLKFSSPEVVKAYEAWLQLSQKGYLNIDATTVPQADATAKFLSGDAAMLFNSGDASVDLGKALKDKLGMMRFPYLDDSNPNKVYHYSGPGLNYCITNYSKHPDEAFKLIKVFTSPEFQLDYFNERGNAPNLTNLDASKITDPVKQQLFKIIKENKAAPVLDLIPTGVLSEIWRTAPLLLTGKMKVPEAMAYIDKELAKDLKK